MNIVEDLGELFDGFAETLGRKKDLEQYNFLTEKFKKEELEILTTPTK